MSLAVRNDTLGTLVGTDGDYAPLQLTSTGELRVEAALSATDNAVLDAAVVLLGTIDSDTDAIKTAVELLDNCVGGTELQCDVLTLPAITGTVTANLSATDNAVLDAAVVLLGTIDSDTDAIKTDMAAIEVLSTAANGILTTIDADTGAIKTDVAAIEVLSTAANALLTTIDSDTGAIRTDIAAIEVLSTAANGILTTMDADTSAINAHVASRLSRTNVDIGSSFEDDEYSPEINMTDYTEFSISAPTSATNQAMNLTIWGSDSSGGTFYRFESMRNNGFNTYNGNAADVAYNAFSTTNWIPCYYAFVKIRNETGAIITLNDGAGGAGNFKVLMRKSS